MRNKTSLIAAGSLTAAVLLGGPALAKKPPVGDASGPAKTAVKIAPAGTVNGGAATITVLYTCSGAVSGMAVDATLTQGPSKTRASGATTVADGFTCDGTQQSLDVSFTSTTATPFAAGKSSPKVVFRAVNDATGKAMKKTNARSVTLTDVTPEPEPTTTTTAAP